MLAGRGGSYRKALWHERDVVVHLFTVKDAMSGVILPVTRRWDVPLGVVRGYGCVSFIYSVAQGVKNSSKRTVYVYQLGDHDLSGVDAWRAFREGIAGFLGERVTVEMTRAAARHGLRLEPGRALGVSETVPDEDFVGDYVVQVTYGFLGGHNFHRVASRKVMFARLAVTDTQIEAWGLRTRRSNKWDLRAKHFAGASVEVDAIRVPQLRALLVDAITSDIGLGRFERYQLVAELERASLLQFLGSWGVVATASRS